MKPRSERAADCHYYSTDTCPGERCPSTPDREGRIPLGLNRTLRPDPKELRERREARAQLHDAFRSGDRLAILEAIRRGILGPRR